jgi:hypothetical protein
MLPRHTTTTNTAKTTTMTKMPETTKLTPRLSNSAKRADRDGTNQLCPTTRRSAPRPALAEPTMPKIVPKSPSRHRLYQNPKLPFSSTVKRRMNRNSRNWPLSHSLFARDTVNCQTSGPTDRKGESNIKRRLDLR